MDKSQILIRFFYGLLLGLIKGQLQLNDGKAENK